MSNDISTIYTKEQNKKNGRTGYLGWKAEKDTVISPKKYGAFLIEMRRKNVKDKKR